MAEPFNPNAFRQQMAQAGQTPPPPDGGQHPQAMPQAQGHPQSYAPTGGHGHQQPQQVQSVPQQYAPPQQAYAAPQQQHAPQSPAQFRAQPQQGQYQPPQQQFQPQLQQVYAQSPEALGHQSMQSGAAETPPVKQGIFKRKRLKSVATQLDPQMSPHMPNNMNKVMNAPLSARVGGASRAIVFGAGLVVGVLGTMISIMLFSGNDPQQASMAENNAQVNTTSNSDMAAFDASPLGAPSDMMAQTGELTDEMILARQKAGTP